MGGKKHVKGLEKRITELRGESQYDQLPQDIQEAIKGCRIRLLIHYGFKGYLVGLNGTPTILVGDHILPGPFDLTCTLCNMADGKLHRACKVTGSASWGILVGVESAVMPTFKDEALLKGRAKMRRRERWLC